MRVDAGRLGRMAAAGAIAGIIVFIIFNPWMVREEAKLSEFYVGFDFDQMMQTVENLKKQFIKPDPLGAFMFSGTLALLVGASLALANELGSSIKRILLKMGIAACSGAIIGGVLGVAADFITTRLLRFQLLFILIMRPLGWVIMGIGAGAGIGIALGSRARARACMIGGAIGGVIGGGAFDIIGGISLSHNGSISRLFGFIVMCSAVGIAVALVEEVGKKNWVTVLTGAKEGRSYILAKPVTILGRDELADIPLFGDIGVAKQHACFRTLGYLVTLEAAPGCGMEVNGAPTRSARLQDSDVIKIGNHLLRFHQKFGRLSAPQFAPSYPQTPQTNYPQHTIVNSIPAAATGTLILVASAGPHINQMFQFGAGTFIIGRETGCGVTLPMDTIASRRHAEITWNGNSWSIRDLGSRNGLWINGMRVEQHILNLGDQIGVGQTWLRVDGI